MDKNENVTEIDLVQILGAILSNMMIVILSAMTGAFLFYFISSEFIPQKFNSSTSIYVLTQQDDSRQVTYTDLQTGSQLTKDYTEMVKSRTVMNQVIADLDLQNTYKDMERITPDQLARKVSAKSAQDTRILTITVTDTNPTRAQDIANAVRIAAAEQIRRVMDIKAVNVVDYANLPESPISPNKTKNAVIGAMLGFIIACGVVVILVVTDDRIHGADDVERFLGLSTLALIPYDEETDTSLHEKAKAKKKKGKKR